MLELKRLAKPRFPLHLICNFAEVVMDNETGELLKYQHLMQSPKYWEIWGCSSGNDIGILVQGMLGCVKRTNTIYFINKEQVPQDCFQDVIYGKFVVNYFKNKEEKERAR